MRAAIAAILALTLALASCAPRVKPITGVTAARALPSTELPDYNQRVVFRWSFADPDMSFSGEGVARISPPDSARLDFFLAGGIGGGRAVLIGDSLSTPAAPFIERFLPPAPLLWATLGRLIVQGADTLVRVDADTLRAEIGREPRWRITFDSSELRRLERIDGDRLREFVERDWPRRVHYEHTNPRRTLDIEIIRVERSAEFDAAIWH